MYVMYKESIAPNAKNGGVFFIIENNGDESDYLIAASSNKAEKVEIHEHIKVNDTLTMQETSDLLIKPNEKLDFVPGGYHVMLLGLKEPLKTGDKFPVTLTFKNSGSIDVDVHVEENIPENMSHDHHHWFKYIVEISIPLLL